MEDGTRYEGECDENGLPDGRGIHMSQHGHLYEGYFSGGKSNGRGRVIYSDGAYYDGEWKNDQKNGYGIYNFGDDSTYEGYWYGDQMHGYGKYTHPDFIYEGEFNMGSQEGHGIEALTDGHIFIGPFKND